MRKVWNFLREVPSYTVRMADSDIIVNEILCFITNKIDLMDHDSLVLTCSKAFSVDDAVAAKSIMKEACTNTDILGTLRIVARTGSDKHKRNIEDIIAMAHKLGTNGPTFVAKDLRKLPPLTFDSIDVTHLLLRLEKLEHASEIRQVADKKNLKILEKMETELKSVKESEVKTTSLLQTMVEATPGEPRPSLSKDMGINPHQTRDPRSDTRSSSTIPSSVLGVASQKNVTPKTNRDPQRENVAFPPNMVSLKMLAKIRQARENTTATKSAQDTHKGIQQDQAPGNTMRQYSDVLGLGNPLPWKLVSNKKSSNKKLIQGTLESANGVKVATRTIDLFTSWWSPQETCEGAKAFLKNFFFEIIFQPLAHQSLPEPPNTNVSKSQFLLPITLICLTHSFGLLGSGWANFISVPKIGVRLIINATES